MLKRLSGSPGEKGIRLLLGAATAAALIARSSREAAQSPGARQPMPPACPSPPAQQKAGGLRVSQRGRPKPLPVPLECGLGAVTLPKRMAWEHRKESSVCSTSFLSGKQTGFVKPQWLQDIPGPRAGPTVFNSLGEAFPNRPLSEKTLPRGGPEDPQRMHTGPGTRMSPALTGRGGCMCCASCCVWGRGGPCPRSHCVPGEPGLSPRWADTRRSVLCL